MADSGGRILSPGVEGFVGGMEGKGALFRKVAFTAIRELPG